MKTRKLYTDPGWHETSEPLMVASLPNQMMRIGERVGLYDRGKLDLKTDAVVENFHEFVEVQSAPPRRRSAPSPEDPITKQEK